MACGDGCEAEPVEEGVGSAIQSAGLRLTRQGPWALLAVLAARVLLTPRRRRAAKRVRPYLQYVQATARSRRRVHWSRRSRT